MDVAHLNLIELDINFDFETKNSEGFFSLKTLAIEKQHDYVVFINEFLQTSKSAERFEAFSFQLSEDNLYLK